MTPLEIQTSELGRHTLVTLWGELDVTNSSRLTGRLMTIFSRISLAADGMNGRAEGAGVVVHLAELRWCDTTGLSSFIEAARAARELEVGFAVAGAKHRVARILEVTGLERAPWVHDELTDAVRSVHRAEPV